MNDVTTQGIQNITQFQMLRDPVNINVFETNEYLKHFL
jgi:hypothetical protein